MKGLTLVTGSEQTRITLKNQLKEYLGGLVNITSFAIDSGIDKLVEDDLIVLSSQFVLEELDEMSLINNNCQKVIAKRIVNFDYIDKIVILPEGKKVLLVNDVKETAYEAIDELKSIGIDYLDYIPYYPQMDEDISNVEIAITPGEKDKVPSGIKKIYDIGPRIIDFTTIIEILDKLNMLDNNNYEFSQKYLKKIINLTKKTALYANEISDLNEHLRMVIDSLNDGLIVYDSNGIISIVNEKLKRDLRITHSNARGKHIKSVIYNKNILEFLMNKNIYEETFLNVDGIDLIGNKFYLFGQDYIVASFKNLMETIETNEKWKRDLVKKGYYAKYAFDDIVGESKEIRKTKEIAKKLAKTDLTILIEGESGTGKEMFASAIHNYSNRSKGPFLAVNCSALPDNLIESELFGYEEGAFTGAKKGGKLGLFEQADGGTLFLDEIGDISLKVQAKLLRVLEEKEIMRVGGHEIKPIDVRVITATNKDLESLVSEEKFRNDLYYRIKVGYISLVPLRYRKVDIIHLINYFINTESTTNVQISKEVMDKLLSHEWYGNVRELKNIFSYMLAMKKGNVITLDDLPSESYFENSYRSEKVRNKQYSNLNLGDKDIFILKKIYEANKSQETIGRDKLALKTMGTKYEMTKYQMRTKLDELEERNFVKKSKGRRGTILTETGRGIVESNWLNGG